LGVGKGAVPGKHVITPRSWANREGEIRTRTSHPGETVRGEADAILPTQRNKAGGRNNYLFYREKYIRKKSFNGAQRLMEKVEQKGKTVNKEAGFVQGLTTRGGLIARLRVH